MEGRTIKGELLHSKSELESIIRFYNKTFTNECDEEILIVKDEVIRRLIQAHRLIEEYRLKNL